MNKQEMRKLEQNIYSKITANTKPKDLLILGLSGGQDSVFLFYMLKDMGANFICAHLNHKLRDKESMLDQVFCTNLCKAHHKELFIKTRDIKKIAQETKKGIEESGRIERYKFFNQLFKKQKAKYILTAHHAEDNAETIIKNLARGSGIIGLSGMEEIQKNIFRPLLKISKQEITKYLETKKIPYQTDSTNTDTKYQRNYIRHEIMPHFFNLNPSFTKTLSKNSMLIKEIEDLLNILTDNFIKNHCQESKNGTNFESKAFKKIHPAIQRQVIKKICKNREIESVHIEEIIDLINKNIGKKSKTIKTKKITIDKGIIFFDNI